MQRKNFRERLLSTSYNSKKAKAAAFAKAMARSVFGRYYVDNEQLAEVIRATHRKTPNKGARHEPF